MMSDNSLFGDAIQAFYRDERLDYAHILADYLRRIGYPYLGIRVETEHPYPLVTFWNDSTESNFYLAFVVTEDDYDAAQTYAEGVAIEAEANGDAPCGAVGNALLKGLPRKDGGS